MQTKVNISLYAAQSAAKFSLKGEKRRHGGLSFTAQNAHQPHKTYVTLGFFLIIEKKPFWVEVIKMKMIVDGKWLETEDEATCDYWDLEDRLYEQYKELKIEGD